MQEEFDIKTLPKKALGKIKAVCKGNGVKSSDIVLKDARGKMIECLCLTHINLEPSLEQITKKGRHQVGEYIENPKDLEKLLQETAAGALKKDETRKFLTDKVMGRPDKGFGLHGETFEIEQFNRTFYTLDPCDACQGVGNTVCTQCRGQRKEPCNICQTRGVQPCDFCNGVGYTQENGQQRQCNRCFGQRHTACKGCQRTGFISCRKCRGSGTNTCKPCSGAAFMTRIAKLAIKIKTAFEIDRAELPPTAIHMMEKMGPRLAENKHIQIYAEPIKRDDGGLAIQYQTRFPHGDMAFSIKDQDYKTELIGFKAKFVKLPDFLDVLLRNAFGNLKKAANNPSSAQNMIGKLIKRRFFADAILYVSEMPGKKAVLALRKQYPVGASKKFIQETILLARKALNNASRSARWLAYAGGAGAAAATYVAYFIGPIRGFLSPPVNLAVDFALVLTGTALIFLAVKIFSTRPISRIIERIDPARAARKKRIRVSYTQPIVLAVSLFVIIALVSVLVFEKTILWLPL